MDQNTFMEYGAIVVCVWFAVKAVAWRYRNREYFRFKKRMEREMSHYVCGGEY